MRIRYFKTEPKQYMLHYKNKKSEKQGVLLSNAVKEDYLHFNSGMLTTIAVPYIKTNTLMNKNIKGGKLI